RSHRSRTSSSEAGGSLPVGSVAVICGARGRCGLRHGVEVTGRVSRLYGWAIELEGAGMGFPSDIGIVDTMLGFPHPDSKRLYAFITRQTKDRESKEDFAFPAEYMFKDVPA